jgi:hypothetical protein
LRSAVQKEKTMARSMRKRARIAMARGKRMGFARAARAARNPMRGLGGEVRAPKIKSPRSSFAREMNK